MFSFIFSKILKNYAKKKIATEFYSAAILKYFANFSVFMLSLRSRRSDFLPAFPLHLRLLPRERLLPPQQSPP